MADAISLSSTSKLFPIHSSKFEITSEIWDYLLFFKYEAVIISMECAASIVADPLGNQEYLNCLGHNLHVIVRIHSQCLLNNSIIEVYYHSGFNFVFCVESPYDFEVFLSLNRNQKNCYSAVFFNLTKCEAENWLKDIQLLSLPYFFQLSPRTEENGLNESLQIAMRIKNTILEDKSFPIIYSLENDDLRAPKFYPFVFKTNNKFHHLLHDNKIQFSFVIPMYNRSKFICRVLDSFLSFDSSKTSFEVILVDDGSDDGSELVVTSWVKRHSPSFNIQYLYLYRSQYEIEKTINRVGPARNHGALHANGDILIFVDSDIILPKNIFQSICDLDFDNKIYQPRRVDISYHDTYNMVTGESDAVWDLPFPTDKCKLRSSLYDGFRSWAASYCWIVSKEVFQKTGGFRSAYITYGWEDTDLIYKCMEYKIFLIELPFNVGHLYTLDCSSEYQNRGPDRLCKLSAGGEVFFRNTLSKQQHKKFIDSNILTFLINSGYGNPQSATNDHETDLKMWQCYYALNDKPVSRDFVIQPEDSQEISAILDFFSNYPISLGKTLMISKKVSMLPTQLIAEMKLGVSFVRNIMHAPQAHFTDDFLNHKYIDGWVFKAAQPVKLEINQSRISLTLTRYNLSKIDLLFDFDTLIIDDLSYFSMFKKCHLLPGTKIICHGHSADIERMLSERNEITAQTHFLKKIGNKNLFVGEVKLS